MEDIFAIEASDTQEVKSVKEKLNLVYKKAGENSSKMTNEAKEAFKTEVKDFINQNAELKSQLTTILEQKAETDKKLQDQQEAILEINRFRASAQANESKGISFDEALSKAMDENADGLEKMREKKCKQVNMELKAVGAMGLSSISGLTTINVQTAPGVINIANRKIHMRDILPTGRMSTSIYAFLKEIGFDGSIASWQENSGAKPQFDIRYVEASAPSQFIAGYITISRKSLDDIPALKASLSQRLLQKYLDAEDTQILQGTGATGQLSGLYLAGNSLSYGPGQNYGGRTKSVEMIVDAMSVIEELNHQATDILLRPRGYNDIMLSQSSGTTNGIYSLPGQGYVTNNAGRLNIAGADAWKSTAQVDNTFLTGDFQMGAQILLREDPIVEFFEQDGDNVKNNQITVRVEGRIALPIYYNDAFIHGTFVNPGS